MQNIFYTLHDFGVSARVYVYIYMAMFMYVCIDGAMKHACVCLWKSISFWLFSHCSVGSLACGLDEIVKSCSLVGTHFVFFLLLAHSFARIRLVSFISHDCLAFCEITMLATMHKMNGTLVAIQIWCAVHTGTVMHVVFRATDTSTCYGRMRSAKYRPTNMHSNRIVYYMRSMYERIRTYVRMSERTFERSSSRL